MEIEIVACTVLLLFSAPSRRPISLQLIDSLPLYLLLISLGGCRQLITPQLSNLK